MTSCEKCWRDAGGIAEKYHRLLRARSKFPCTLKEQVGEEEIEVGLSQWPEKFKRPERSEFVTLKENLTVKVITPGAVGFIACTNETWIDSELIWIPKSVLLDGDTYERGYEYESIEVEGWFARKEELDHV